jgi:phosphoribosylformimino-5-aminoimidazole carboxamide ribotide isomerase
MEVIPAIDLLGGKAVRLLKGRYEDVTVYDDDPAGLARSWSGRAPRLHVVDLEGARAGHAVQRELVAELVRGFGRGVQVGGGVRSIDSLKSYFDLGVERVVLGTVALRDPELVARAAEMYPGRIVIAVDARGGRVATAGWLEQSERLAADVLGELAVHRLAAALYTDIDRDGTEIGPNIEVTRRLAEATAVPVIASGGVGSLAHLIALAQTQVIAGAIVGRALHEGRFSLEEACLAAKSATQAARSE